MSQNIRMYSYISLVSHDYDGASVNSRKNKFKFIFSTVFFTKTAEKINLNLFSPSFFQKQQKKNI